MCIVLLVMNWQRTYPVDSVDPEIRPVENFDLARLVVEGRLKL